MTISISTRRRVVLSYGIFDQFSPADADRLRSLSHLGDEVIVGCATDAFCADMGLSPFMPYAARREILESCRFVARVIPQVCADQQRTDIVNYNVGVFVADADCAGQFDHLQDLAQVRYLPQQGANIRGLYAAPSKIGQFR